MIAVLVLGCMGVGLLLGALGGGGAIFAVPLLVYAGGFAPADAGAMSLAIVGVTSVLASVGYARTGQVHAKSALALGAAGAPAAVLGGVLAQRVPGSVLVLAFGGLMLAAGGWMLLSKRPPRSETAAPRLTWSLALLTGVGIGLLTGFLGVGGGFLIVPALVLVARLPLRTAVGTSLVVIAVNSVAGLVGHAGQGDLNLLATASFAAIALLGAMAGTRLAASVDASTLRRVFAWLVVGVGVAMIASEVSL